MPLRLAIRQLASPARSLAPQTLEVALENRLGVLLEGELELTIYVGRKPVQTFRSEPLMLGADTLRFRITIPPIVKHHDRTAVTVVGRFLSNRGEFELRDQDIVIPPYFRRSLVVAVSRPDDEARFQDKLSLESTLPLERFNSLQGDWTDIQTRPSIVAPIAFPTTIAGLTGYDVVVLEGEGFTKLRDAQLTALAGWVDAGGSVLVDPTGVLRPAQLGFLNRIAGEPAGELRYALDDRLWLARSSPATREPIARYHYGLGRAAIVHRSLKSGKDFSGVDWAETTMFLWKVRRDQQEAIRQTGFWNYQIPPKLTRQFEQPRPVAPQEGAVESELRRLLIPREVQGVPFWVVVAILSLFLLVIAPGDYFVLGMLRARRYTWFSLTVLSLAFTIGTVRIAERVLGTSDYRTAVTFVDIGNGGRPVRSSRYELIFTATQKMRETRFQDGLYVAIDDRISGLESVKPYEGYYVAPMTAEEEQAPPTGLGADLPVFSGKLPADVTVRQQMRQWSPLVNRQTLFESTSDLSSLDWESLGKFAWRRSEGRQELLAAVREREPGAHVLLLHRSSAVDLASSAALREDLFTPLPGQAAMAPVVDPEELLNRAGGHAEPAAAPPPVARVVTPNDPILALVNRVSVGPPRGYFGIVSQVAPTGGASFEDLALLDPSDEEQWLLAVVVKRDGDFVAFRRLYRENVR
ncbi:MAG TPA: hypothetical protein VL475_10160 [Planctomycetaceae bacterium]|nr:hypothetical protein [Planctomycetaceae bacterium]